MVIGLLLTTCIGTVLYFFISLHIPSMDSLAAYKPLVTSVVLDDQGQVIERIYKQNRTIVPIEKMPRLLPLAFVAAEDARFFQHGGVDGWSIIRALAHNIKTGERGQGGSTITQQVARSLLLTPEKTYTRKIKEAILAYKIDRLLSKESILHIYLNQIYLGSGAYGVEAAAQIYFDKHVWELNLAEITLLAGLPQAPSRYSPYRHFKLAKKRQVYVLNRMAEEGYITPTAARKAYRTPLFWAPPPQYADENKYFIQHVINYVKQKYGGRLLTTGGLTIHTTLQQPLQKAAGRTIKKGVAKWAVRQASSSYAENQTAQGALVCIDTNTGYVKAITGGVDYNTTQFDRAIQARREPGSAFKPIIYAAALAQGLTPATVIVDEPLHLQGSTPGSSWRPQNFSGRYYGPTTLRNGLIYSRNIVTIKLLQHVGIPTVTELALHMGINSPLAENLALALGSSGVSLLELTAAYGTFANHGVFMRPIMITKIEDQYGTVLESNRPEARQVLDERVAYQITSLLKKVITEGTGKAARGLGAPAAGKTGTTNNNMDAWFIGYTPRLAAGVWVGYDTKLSLGKNETGGSTAAPIWRDFMAQALEYYPSADFEKPDGIVILPMDRDHGTPATRSTEKVSWEAFQRGNLPWKDDNTESAAFEPL